MDITAPSTDAAKQWSGWGTALKPAAEFWFLVRKPCSEKTVAANVLKWGTGGLNIDGSRIQTSEKLSFGSREIGTKNGVYQTMPKDKQTPGVQAENGRFPANLVLSHSSYCTEIQCDIECAVEMLDEQSGMLKSGERKPQMGKKKGSMALGDFNNQNINHFASDSGGASRFFYCAKISASERGAENKHPTVKSKKLMGYLIGLITPPGGLVLDPFMGSGSTGIVAKEMGFQFIGIEKHPEYQAIAQARINNGTQNSTSTKTKSIP